ncbi:MAG: Gfo/Idh/MocA family oxidoreductase [Armatimonadetes bacterium]|nr:Gfo/Idh/MocA family oxidoreductase [Armatimonadota bacterium]
MTEPLKAVITGCGGMSGAWLNAVKEIPDVTMVGFVDIREEAARKRAEEYGYTDAFIGTELPRVLDQAQSDVVFDVTIPEAHTDVTVTALKHGCHVLGEKPMADSMENAKRACATARETGKIYAVIQNRRYDSRIRRLKSFLNSQPFGKLTTVNSDFYIGAHFGGFRDRMEHVLLLDMAIHSFDQARFITGADPVSVYCKEWNPAGSWYDHDASAIAIFQMTDGLVYTYRGSWCAEGLNTSWECEWRIVGETGTATWNGHSEFKAQRAKQAAGFHSELETLEVPEVDAGDKQGGHKGLIREFVQCVRTGGTPETVCTDNIKSLAMVFGAIESADQGKEIEITW